MVVETDRRGERKWAREPGARRRRSPAPSCCPPPFGLGPPGRALPSAAFHSLDSCVGEPAAPRSREGSRTGRGKGRDEAGEERQKGEEKRGVCRGRVGWGRLCQFNPEGVSFIYLFFKKICHESHYTDLPEERRKRVGSEGGRVREVNLKIPLNLKVCKFAWLSVFMSGFFPPHHFHFRPTIMCSRGC